MPGLAANLAFAVGRAQRVGAPEAITGGLLAAVRTVCAETFFKFGNTGFKSEDGCANDLGARGIGCEYILSFHILFIE